MPSFSRVASLALSLEFFLIQGLRRDSRKARNLTSTDACESWCESDYSGGSNPGRHCSPGDMADLCGGCSFCDPPTPTPAPPPTPAPAPTPAPPPTPASPATFLQWNVHWQNRNIYGIADIISKTPTLPDIIGLCELTANAGDMATAISSAMGRSYRVQPSRGGFQGYGTDIFFDDGKWEVLEDGIESPPCSSLSGSRAANWIVLQDRQTGKKVISGGIHLSYCSNGCDSLHECELGHLYTKFEAMKQRHGEGTPVVWMGDTNRVMSTRIMQNLLQGRLGSRQVFRVDDMAQTQGNTYHSNAAWGLNAIDFILGDAGLFHRKAGGRTGHGTTGQWLANADHFPIYADVDLL